MSPHPSTARFTGARPVADAPVDALVALADELASRWASALVAARPLAEMARVPLEALSREAPAVCAQLARALSSDAELERLLAPAVAGERGNAPESRSSALAVWLEPAGDASATVSHVEALRGVIWAATLGELGDPTARQVADLSDRLAFACAALLAAALDQRGLGATLPTPSPATTPARERVLYSSPQTPGGGRRAVLIDEHEETVQPARRTEAPVAGRAGAPVYKAARSPREAAPERRETSRPASTAPRPRPWDTPLDAVSRSASGLQDPTPHRVAPDGGGAEMRIMRGPGASVDERA